MTVLLMKSAPCTYVILSHNNYYSVHVLSYKYVHAIKSKSATTIIRLVSSIIHNYVFKSLSQFYCCVYTLLNPVSKFFLPSYVAYNYYTYLHFIPRILFLSALFLSVHLQYCCLHVCMAQKCRHGKNLECMCAYWLIQNGYLKTAVFNTCYCAYVACVWRTNEILYY